MNNEVMLSIYIATYNHEKYIAQALDGVLKQKTSYSYEILVGEDCSPDGTRDILKQYEKKYPGKFRMFYREKNMHGQHPNNAGDLKRRCRGKYIIALEGDDYWIDENKIQKQIEFLEKHEDYVAVAHNCIVVDENSNPCGKSYPECKDEEYTIKHFASEIMPGQLTTVMCRNYIKDDTMDTAFFLNKGLSPGDRLAYFAFILNGKVYCIQEPMSAYRQIRKSGTSFTAAYKYNFKKEERWNYALIEYSEKNNFKDGIKYGELLYFRNLISGLSSKQCSVRQMLNYMKNINHKFRTVVLYIRHWIRHHVLHKTLWV